MIKNWGFSLALDCKNCKIFTQDRVKDGVAITKFFQGLVKKIDMIPYGDLLLQNFANHNPAKGGYTAVQLIETSAIVGHFVDLNGDAYIDIFSCKLFNPNIVMDHTIQYLQPDNIKGIFVNRGTKTQFSPRLIGFDKFKE